MRIGLDLTLKSALKTGPSDVTAPTVVITLSDYAFKIGDTATATFTFSEAPTGFAEADVTAPNGSLSSFGMTGDPLIYTAIFTPTADVTDPTNVITVGTGWTDAVGNPPAGATTSDNYTVDTTAPTVVIAVTGGSPSATLPLPITFTLSEVATDFAVGDVTVGGGSIANFAGSGTAYTCEGTPTTPNGTMTFDVAGNAFHDAAGNGNTAAVQLSVVSSAFAMYDEFSDTLAAGSVNGTTATDGVSVRTVTDANSKLSLPGTGVASFATGGVGAGNPGIWYPGVARGAGKALIGKLAGTNTNYSFGWDINQAGQLVHGLNFQNGSVLRIFIYTANVTGPTPPANNAATYCAIIQRAAGAFVLIKEATAFPNWTLLYMDNAGAEATLYPAAQANGVAAIFSEDFIRQLTNNITITPLASDNFTAANGALGNTRGGGSEEAGGSGLAWTSQLGTHAIATNKATCSALDGGTGLGVATVNASNADVMIECIITRAAGNMGLVLRWTDASNYIVAFYDGTNWTINEIVSGTPNTILAATAATYGATKRTVISLNGTKIRLHYGDALVGSEATTVITTGNNHGLYTSNTGATFDNFVVWLKKGGAYDTALNPFLA